MKKEVTFKNSNLNMKGHIFLPQSFDDSKKYAAIVCVHPGGGVKEQTAGTYAQKLADFGFVTLAFDASHQGESEGDPRYLESPAARVEDIRCAVDYLVTLPYADEDKIGALGICAAGGYVLNAASTERRIKAVTGISSVDIGGFMREGIGKANSPEVQSATLDAVAKQRTAEARGADPLYVGYVGDTADDLDDETPVLFKEGYDYYRTPRGQHPHSVNKMLFTSTAEIMGFSAFEPIPAFLKQPLLLVAGEQADTRYFSEEAFELATGDKELFLVEGATHVALYDLPEYVDQVAGKIQHFFSTKLAVEEFAKA